MSVPNSTFDQVSAITDDWYASSFNEVAFNKHPLFSKLHGKGSKPSSGNKIKVTLKYQKSKGGAYAARGTVDVGHEDVITAARFPWKNYYVPVSLFRDEILDSDGPEGVRDLLEANLDIAMSKIADDLATDLMVTGTGFYNDDDIQINSLVGLASDNTYPAAATIGEIPKSNTFWRGYAAAQATGSLALSDLAGVWFNLVLQNTQPDMLICNEDVMQLYWALAQPAQRLLRETEAHMGFTALSFNGAPLILDPHCSATEIFFLTTKFLDLVSHKKENMRFEKFQTPINQNAGVAKIYWRGNITCSDCRRQGVLHTIS